MARHASSYRAGRRGMARADATGRALSDVWLDYRIGGEPRTRSNRFAPVISPRSRDIASPRGTSGRNTGTRTPSGITPSPIEPVTVTGSVNHPSTSPTEAPRSAADDPHIH